MNASRIHDDAEAERQRRRRSGGGRELHSVLWEELGHGDWLHLADTRRQVINCIFTGEGRGEGGESTIHPKVVGEAVGGAGRLERKDQLRQ